MGEDLRRRPARRPSGQRQFWRRTAPRQRRADLALPQVEPFPDAQPGAVTEVAVNSADGCKDRAGDGVLEEAPQTGGSQAEPTDLVGVPNAEGPPATRACLAVAAKDPPCAYGFAPGATVVKSVQRAMPIQGADSLAMGTRRLLEPLSNRLPVLGIAEKPTLLAHGDHASAKIVILAAWGRSGVLAGYDKNLWSELRGKSLAGALKRGSPFCQIVAATNIPKSADNSVTFARKRDQSEVKDKCARPNSGRICCQIKAVRILAC